MAMPEEELSKYTDKIEIEPKPGDVLISYIQAIRMLEARGATPEELLVWVWTGLIQAYLDRQIAQDGTIRRLLPTDLMNWKPGEYKTISATPDAMLSAIYFSTSEVEEFNLATAPRYLSYDQVINRWKPARGENFASQVLQDKLKAGELDNFHPAVEQPEQGIYCTDQVEKVEQEYFGSTAPLHKKRQPSGLRKIETQKRQQAWRAKAEELYKTNPKLTKRDIAKQIAKDPTLNPKNSDPESIRRQI